MTGLTADGHDVTWMRDAGPGSLDPRVLALAFAEGRIVLTFDEARLKLHSTNSSKPPSSDPIGMKRRPTADPAP